MLCCSVLLYNIEKLHQTTTRPPVIKPACSCIILKNYIKPQRVTSVCVSTISCIILKNYIKPQPHTFRTHIDDGCIILKNYIKPQQKLSECSNSFCCIILKNYIKPQRPASAVFRSPSCIILKNYIKPQLADPYIKDRLCCIILKNYIKPQRRAYNRLISACLCGILADKTRPETSPKSIRCCFCISKNESNSFFRRIQVVGAFRAGPVRFCPKNS